MERSQLAHLRTKKHWSQQHAAALLGVDVTTLNRWEQGRTKPHLYNIEKLCTAYGCSEADLGLQYVANAGTLTAQLPSDVTDEAPLFLVSDPTMRLFSLAFSLCSYHLVQHEVRKLLEDDTMNDSITRREALRRLATLPIATLHLNTSLPTFTHAPETVLAQCGAGVVACWYLRKGKELSLADSAVSAYIPTLREIVASSSQYRKDAADLLVQCYLLKAVLSWNITTPIDGISHAQQAENYSKIAEKPLLQVASLRAQAAALCYANQWGQALHTGLQAKYVMETTPKEVIPQLTRSYVYAGLATYQAYHGQKQDALTSLKKAHTTFFEQLEAEAVPLWIDHSIGNLLLNDGLTHAQLGLYKGAVDSFGQIEKNYAEDVTVPFGCRIEARIEQATAEVSRDDQARDMEQCIALWMQGIEGAKAMRSNKHFDNALVAYTAMRAAWPGETRIKELRDLAMHW